MHRLLHVVDDGLLELLREELRQGVISFFTDDQEVAARRDNRFDVLVCLAVEITARTAVRRDRDVQEGALSRSNCGCLVRDGAKGLLAVAKCVVTSLNACHCELVLRHRNHLNGLDDGVELLVALELVLVEAQLSGHPLNLF